MDREPEALPGMTLGTMLLWAVAFYMFVGLLLVRLVF